MLEERNLGDSQESQNSGSESKRIADLEKKIEQMIAASANNSQPNQSGVTPEFLEKLIDKVSAKSSDIKNSIDSEFDYVDEAVIEEDDYLEDGHVFWCHQAGYVIVDDKRMNRSVPTPLKTKIVFEYVHTERRGSGKDIQLYLLSKYVSHSKKEVEWIKNSTYYNRIVFDDISKSGSKQSRKAAKINQMLNKVRAMERTQFYKSCKVAKIEYNKDREVMNLALASFYADKSLLEEMNHSKRIAQDHAAEQEILNTLT